MAAGVRMSSARQTMSEYEAIPQMDLAAQYAVIGGEIREAVTRVLASQQFVLGKEGLALEGEIAGLCGVRHGIGVASGTDALILALRAVGVGAGDEVILPPYVCRYGARSCPSAQSQSCDTSIQPHSIFARRSHQVQPRYWVVHLMGWRRTWIPFVLSQKATELRL
jgi:hypothetical protein